MVHFNEFRGLEKNPAATLILPLTFKLYCTHLSTRPATRYYVARGNVPFGARGVQVTDTVRSFAEYRQG